MSIRALLPALVIVSSCARATTPPSSAVESCRGAPATPVSLRGDFHVVFASTGADPGFHLVWSGRSGTLEFDDRTDRTADSLLTFARQRVLVRGTATADTSWICVRSIVREAGAP